MSVDGGSKSSPMPSAGAPASPGPGESSAPSVRGAKSCCFPVHATVTHSPPTTPRNPAGLAHPVRLSSPRTRNSSLILRPSSYSHRSPRALVLYQMRFVQTPAELLVLFANELDSDRARLTRMQAGGVRRSGFRSATVWLAFVAGRFRAASIAFVFCLIAWPLHTGSGRKAGRQGSLKWFRALIGSVTIHLASEPPVQLLVPRRSCAGRGCSTFSGK